MPNETIQQFLNGYIVATLIGTFAYLFGKYVDKVTK